MPGCASHLQLSLSCSVSCLSLSPTLGIKVKGTQGAQLDVPWNCRMQLQHCKLFSHRMLHASRLYTGSALPQLPDCTMQLMSPLSAWLCVPVVSGTKGSLGLPQLLSHA